MRLGDLINLQELYLQNAMHEDVNQDWLNVTQVNGNKIDRLPNEISKLVNLRMIDLSYNFITQLPKGFGNLECN